MRVFNDHDLNHDFILTSTSHDLLERSKKLVKGLDLFAIKINSRDNIRMLSRPTFIKMFLFLVSAIASNLAWSENVPENGVRFISEVDNLLTLNTITVGSGYDNVGGMYKKSAEEILKKLIMADHMWSFAENKDFLNSYRNDELYEDSEKAKEFLNKTNADGFLMASTIKGNQGLSVELTLFSVLQGLPVVQVHHQDLKTFEMSEFEKILGNLYSKIKGSLPYSGLVRSRRGNTLTINLGFGSGIKAGDQVTFIQILQVKRHPKLNFIVSVDKEIIGQGTVKKSDDTMSFVDITYEKEQGVIQKNAKIQRLSNINYSDPQLQIAQNFDPTKEEEWLPPSIPQFGFAYAGFGFTDYKMSSILVDGTSLNSGNSFAPTFNLGAELWVTKSFIAQFNYKQAFFAGKNSLTGSSPDNVNFTFSQTDFGLGFRQQIGDNFWGPHVKAVLGYYDSNHQVSDTQPTSFTSFKTSGMSLGLGGYFPVTKDNDMALGVDTKFILSPSFSETPVTSGIGDTSVTDFSFYGVFQWTTNMQFKGIIKTNSIQQNFTGGTSTRTNPARSVEVKTTTYGLNLEYLF